MEAKGCVNQDVALSIRIKNDLWWRSTHGQAILLGKKYSNIEIGNQLVVASAGPCLPAIRIRNVIGANQGISLLVNGCLIHALQRVNLRKIAVKVISSDAPSPLVLRLPKLIAPSPSRL